MGRRRSAALQDTAGVYHVASRLAYEGFRATVARGSSAGADVLAGLPGSTATAPLAVRTAECPPGFGGADEGKIVACEWRVGKRAAPADDPGLFVALVDLKRAEWSPRVWLVPSGEVRGRIERPGEGRPYRYRASAEELAPHEEDWDAVEDHLRRRSARRTAWFDRGELAERYGEEFVEALDAEASRLLDVQNSITRRMADGRFPAEDLADASALLSVLFRRWMEQKRRRK
ncbi:MAG: hypothetical protein WKF95_19405 [Rubrobacter sp.]